MARKYGVFSSTAGDENQEDTSTLVAVDEAENESGFEDIKKAISNIDNIVNVVEETSVSESVEEKEPEPKNEIDEAKAKQDSEERNITNLNETYHKALKEYINFVELHGDKAGSYRAFGGLGILLGIVGLVFIFCAIKFGGFFSENWFVIPVSLVLGGLLAFVFFRKLKALNNPYGNKVVYAVWMVLNSKERVRDNVKAPEKRYDTYVWQAKLSDTGEIYTCNPKFPFRASNKIWVNKKLKVGKNGIIVDYINSFGQEKEVPVVFD